MSVERWAWGSVAVNVVLAALHGLVAATSGSLGVGAELIHNVADLLAAAAVLLGLKLAARKSRAFPYGLYKVENLVAAGLAGMIFLTAYEIMRDAVLGAAGPVRVDGWMLAVLVATLAIPLTFSRFELRAGQAANSPALIADAREYRVHVFTTGLVFASLVSEWFRFPLDRVAALLIGVVIVKTGWNLLADAMRVLLDASLDTEALRRIRAVIDGEPTVAEVTWVTGRNAGRFRFVEAGVVLRGGELTKVEAAVQRIEASVRAAVQHVERVLVHVEPATSASIRYAVPLADAGGTVSTHFGDAPYFALVSVRRADGAVEAHEIIGNPWRREERAKGIRVAEWLVAHKVDVVLLKEDVQGKGPAYVLRNAGVEQRWTDATTVSEALAACGANP
jgi:cation diffusion facilitator family transporter